MKKYSTIKYLAAWLGCIAILIAVSRAGNKTQTLQPAPMPATMKTESLSKAVPIKALAAPPLPDVPLDKELIIVAVDSCNNYGVPVELALAVMKVESEFQTDAKNGACVGLYQINTLYLAAYEEALGITDINDPSQNIKSGVWYLGQLIKKHGEVNLALMHYNLGNKADRLWTQGSYSTHYTDKVNIAWEHILKKENEEVYCE